MPEQDTTGVHKDFEYYAFISYSRKDEKWAKRIQQELEQYRLPMVLYKESDALPKNIRPVFRDVTDLSAGQLQSELHRQLDDSKKLIVICSPHSAASAWVNKEVQHYIDVRGIENVIPFIVDGKPNGGEDECFPEALQLPEEDQLLGISVIELGWRDAFLRMVSGLLDVRFDSLKRRHEQRQRRNRMIAAAVTLLVLTLASFAGYSAWDYFAPHEAYFADYALRWGIPEGIGALDEEELSGRAEHYVIVTQRRRVVRLVHANADGLPIPHTHTERLDRPIIAHYSYGDDGQIHTVEYLDRDERTLLAQYYAPDLKTADYIAGKDNSSFRTLGASTTSMNEGMLGINTLDANTVGMKGDITRHAFEYDENGFVTKTVYMRDNRQTPVRDIRGIGGLSYTTDGLGRVVEVRYLGLGGGEYAAEPGAVAGKRFTYDDAYNLIREEYMDASGGYALNERGWMIAQIEYDSAGRAIRQAFLDANGDPMTSYDEYAAVEWSYDARGNATAERYMDTEGLPTDGVYGYCAVRAEYDERCNRTLWTAYDADERPTLNVYGYASMGMEYDERGRLIREAYMDGEGELVLIYAGYAMVSLEYGEHGMVSRASYYDADEQPVIMLDGYAAIGFEYDERGNVTLLSCFGTDGMPIISAYGMAFIINDYDERGNVIRNTYLGTDGQPILNYDGLAAEEMEYDERGNRIRTSFFGTDGRAILSDVYGCAGFLWEYDEMGNAVGESSFDADGRPILNAFGYARIEMAYDEHGNMIREVYYDADGYEVWAEAY